MQHFGVKTVFALITASALVIRIQGTVDLENIGKPNDENLPIILWWDGLGRAADVHISCPNDLRCFVTENHSHFHEQDIMVYGFYGTQFLASGLPFPRQEGDLWALLHEESPKNNDFMLTFEDVLNFFNYSSTFKRESHFPLTSHWLESKDYLLSQRYFVSTEEKNRYRKKEKYAPVIFVQSDCSTPSDRDGYMKQLMEYVDVDSYGDCLHNKDFPEGGNYKGLQGFTSDDFLTLIGRYKFAVAFENALCDDYITEKLWRPLHVGSVPIVKGSSKVKDFLPSEKSALVIDDFDSIEELGKFIKQLDEDDEEYETYLQFKEDGISNPYLAADLDRHVKGGPQNFGSRMHGFECYLCEKLHAAIVAKADGNPIPRAQVDADHLNCSLPSKKWNSKGKLVDDPNRGPEALFYRKNAAEMIKFYNKGENITSHELYVHTHKLLETAGVKDEL